jgi:leader peptidase (prepilin peptidase)/N-methyltransferase
LTTLLFFQDGLTLVTLEKVVAALILFAILLIDFDTWLIPLVLPISLVGWGLFFGLLGSPGPNLVDRAAGTAVGFGFLAVILVGSTWLLRRTGRLQKDEHAMGWGDPVLMGGIGAVLGVALLPFVVWIGCIQALVAYVVLRFTQRDFATIAEEAHTEQDFVPPARALPLGTFLALAAMEIIVAKGYFGL